MIAFVLRSLTPQIITRSVSESGAFHPRLRFGLLLLLPLLPLSGCDSGKKPIPPWGRLSGTLTLAGKPAKGVQVVFENRARGIALTRVTDAGGGYEIRSAESAGLPVGAYQVMVVPTYHFVRHAGVALKDEHPEPDFAVPAKYQDAKTSGFTCTIHEGENHVDLELKP